MIFMIDHSHLRHFNLGISLPEKDHRSGRDDLTGNIQAMPAKTMPIDVGFEFAITCGG